MDLSITVIVPNTALFRGEGPLIAGEELVAATEYAVNAIQGRVLPLTPINQGILRGGWQTKVDRIGQPVNVLGQVFNPLGYALPVETGSRPHFPPIEPLALWARRKFSVTEKEARSIGFLVARAISRRGTRPIEMAKRALESVREAIVARFNEIPARMIRRLGQ